MKKCSISKKQLLFIIPVLAIVILGYLVVSDFKLPLISSNKINQTTIQTHDAICTSTVGNECLFGGCNGFF